MSIDTEKMRRAARAVGAFLRPEYGREIQAAADHIDAQAAEIAALRQPWQPIETAPKDGTTIIVWFRQHGAVSVHWPDPDCVQVWSVDDFKHGPYPVRGYMHGDATHWMPLPAPPAALSGEPNG